MRSIRRFAASLFIVASVPLFAGSASADVPAGWDVSVAAMQDVDPSLPVPAVDPTHVIAVGGGRIDLGPGSSPRFGFGATLEPAGVHGEMTLSVGTPATIFHADVICLAAASTGTSGAIATVIGELVPANPATPFLVFTMNDGGPPDGTGDTWEAFFTTLLPPCEPLPAGGTIVGSITINVPVS